MNGEVIVAVLRVAPETGTESAHTVAGFVAAVKVNETLVVADCRVVGASLDRLAAMQRFSVAPGASVRGDVAGPAEAGGERVGGAGHAGAGTGWAVPRAPGPALLGPLDG